MRNPALRSSIVLFLLFVLIPAVLAQGGPPPGRPGQPSSPLPGANDVQRLESGLKELPGLRKELAKLEKKYKKIYEKYKETDRKNPKRQKMRDSLRDLSRQRRQLSMNIRSLLSGICSVIRRIADSGDGKAINSMLGLVYRGRKEPELEIEEAALNALANTKNSETAQYLIEELSRSSNIKVIWVLCEVMKRRKEMAAVDALLKILKSGSSNAKIAAADALSIIRAKSAVEPMIEALERAEKSKNEKVSRALTLALQNMTGRYGLIRASEFRGWWEQEGGKNSYDENVPPPPRSAADGSLKDGQVTTTLYGTIKSKRAIFVCDVSGSMTAKGRIPGDSSGDPDDGKEPPKLGEEGVKPGSSGTRIAMLKLELAFVVKSVLGEDAKFNIITFAAEVQKWKTKLTEATGENRKEAVDFVMAMKAEGGTNTYGALEEAFKDKDVDTIYFLSDGNPSVGDKTRPSDILAAVQRWNRGRSVIVNTIGLLVGKARMEFNKQRLVDFLTKLADQNDGKVKIFKD